VDGVSPRRRTFGQIGLVGDGDFENGEAIAGKEDRRVDLGLRGGEGQGEEDEKGDGGRRVNSIVKQVKNINNN
jgi:hypothetical protein